MTGCPLWWWPTCPFLRTCGTNKTKPMLASLHPNIADVDASVFTTKWDLPKRFCAKRKHLERLMLKTKSVFRTYDNSWRNANVDINNWFNLLRWLCAENWLLKLALVCRLLWIVDFSWLCLFVAELHQPKLTETIWAELRLPLLTWTICQWVLSTSVDLRLLQLASTRCRWDSSSSCWLS